MVDAEASLLPNGTKEGDVLKFDDGIYAIDADPTLERARCVKQLMGNRGRTSLPLVESAVAWCCTIANLDRQIDIFGETLHLTYCLV